MRYSSIILAIFIFLGCRSEDKNDLDYDVLNSINSEFENLSKRIIYLDSLELKISDFEVSNCFYNYTRISNDTIFLKEQYSSFVFGNFITDYSEFNIENLIDTNTYYLDSLRVSFNLSSNCGHNIAKDPFAFDKDYLFISKPVFNKDKDKVITNCLLYTNGYETKHFIYLEKHQTNWNIIKHTLFLFKITEPSFEDSKATYYHIYNGSYEIN